MRRVSDERSQLVKAARQSTRALAFYVPYVVVSGVLVYVLPRWWTWVLFGVGFFTLLGDLLNVVPAKRKLERLASSTSQWRQRWPSVESERSGRKVTEDPPPAVILSGLIG